MDLTVLKQEIAKQEYEGLSDQAIADLLNAKTVVVDRITPTWEVKQHAIENQYWGTIVIATSSNDNTVKGLAICARDWIDDPSGKIQTIDLNKPVVQQMIGGLQQMGLMTPEQVTSLNLLGSETKKWSDANNLPEIGVGIIRSARNS